MTARRLKRSFDLPAAGGSEAPSLAETAQLTQDFSDEELLKLYVLHFHDQDDRSKEELLRMGTEMQQVLLSFARACGLNFNQSRWFVTQAMFGIIGPIAPERE